MASRRHFQSLSRGRSSIYSAHLTIEPLEPRVVLASAPLLQTQVFENDHDGDGAFDVSRHQYIYNSVGHLLRHVVSEDYHGDGSIDLVSSETTFSQTDRTTLSRITREDVNRDGIADIVEEYAYDEDDWLLEHTLTADRNLDGVTDDFFSIRYSYDTDHNLLLYVERRDTNSDGLVDYIFTQESTYGPSQNRLTFVESQDFDGDGTTDLVTQEQRYNEAGYLLYQAVRQDADRDGYLEYFSFLSDTYTSEGRLQRSERRFSTDYDSDGILDAEIQLSNYSDEGILLSTSISHDYQDDGTVDIVSFEQVFNERGERQSEAARRDADFDGRIDWLLQQAWAPDGSTLGFLYSEDFNLDGTVDRYESLDQTSTVDGRPLNRVETRKDASSHVVEIEIYSYDDMNNLRSAVKSRDFAGDGIVEYVLSERIWDASGRPVKEVERADNNFDRRVDYVNSNELTYDGNGILRQQIRETQEDRDFDGVFDVNRWEAVFDARQLQLSVVETRKQGARIDLITNTITNYYDSGVRQSQVTSVDFSGDGKIEFVSFEGKYDEHGRYTLWISRSDTNNDRVADRMTRTVTSYSDTGARSTVSEEYDGRTLQLVSVREEVFNDLHRRLSLVEKQDRDRNGVLEFTYRLIDTVDATGRNLTRIESRDDNGDGMPEFAHSFTYTYDVRGKLQAITETRDDEGDGNIDFTSMTVWTYNDDNREASLVETQIYGATTLVVRETHNDQSGRLLASTTRDDHDRDGRIDRSHSTVNDYNSSGKLVRTVETIRQDRNQDRVLDSATTETTYGDSGQPASLLVSLDYGSNGTVDIVTREEQYDDIGRPIVQIFREEDPENRGTVSSAYMYAYSYFENGELKTHLQQTDSDLDGTFDFVSFESVLDEFRRTLRYARRNDYNGDFVVDELSSVEYTYDAQGNTLTSFSSVGYDATGDGVMDVLNTKTTNTSGGASSTLSWWDYGADDSVDFVTSEDIRESSGGRTLQAADRNHDGFPESFETKTFDTNGNLLSHLEQQDWDSDGVQELSRRTENTYDRLNRQTESRVTLTTSELHQELFYSFAYDDANRLVQQINLEDLDADGTVDRRMTFQWQYDAAGRLVSRTESEDDNADGVPSYVFHATWEYNPNGTLRSSVEESDLDGNGTVDLVGKEETYDDAGRITYRAYRRDDNRDRVLDYVYEEQVRYSDSGDVVFHAISDDRNGDGIVDYIYFQQLRASDSGYLAANVVREDFDGDGVAETENTTRMIYIVAGDTVAIADVLIERVATIDASESTRAELTGMIRNVKSALESNTDESARRAVTSAEQFLEDLPSTQLVDTDRADLRGLAEQLIVFANEGKGSSGNPNGTSLAGDVDSSGQVGFADFLILSSNFGRSGPEIRRADGDLDGDGAVGFSDFLILSVNFGRTA